MKFSRFLLFVVRNHRRWKFNPRNHNFKTVAHRYCHLGIIPIGKPMIMTLKNNGALGTIIWLLWLPYSVSGMMASPHTFTVDNANLTIALRLRGDEQSHWLTDLDDYLVVCDHDGVYKYAQITPDGKMIAGGGYVGEKEDNGKFRNEKKHKRGSHKKTEGSNSQSSKTRDSSNIILDGYGAATKRTGRIRGRGGSHNQDASDVNPFKTPTASLTSPSTGNDPQQRRRATSTVGTLKNLVILIRFPDHSSRKLPSVDEVDVLMNNEEIDNVLAPTGSLKMKYWENSYGQLTIESTVNEWIQVSRSEAFYADGLSGVGTRRRRFHQALVEALESLEDDGFNFSDFDADNDGHIDSITFLTSSYGAEWGGDGYENRIWSHKWEINWRSSKTGVAVTDYHVSPALWGTSGSDIGRVGVIAHETGHFLGLPDLYDTDRSGNGLGFFCMMANSWGYDGSQLHPPHMSAWAKVLLGWTVPQVPTVGTNTLIRTEEYPTNEYPNQVYKIGSEFGFASNEYLLIEYRKPFWLNGGVAIFHIDEGVGYSEEGYPGQVVDNTLWPQNGKHYRIAVLPADGLYELERDINQGNSNDLYKGGAMLLPSNGNRNDGPFPNSDSYQGGDLRQTGVGIFVNSLSGGSTMTFEFATNASPTTFDLPTPAPTLKPTSPNVAPAIVPTPFPTFSPSEQVEEEEEDSDADTRTSTWRKLLEENFDSGTGSVILGNNAKINNKKCLATMCAEIKKESYIQINVDVTALEALAVVFDFYTDGFKDLEEVIVQYAFLDGSTGLPINNNSKNNNGWETVASRIKADNTFPNKQWILQEQSAWYLGMIDQSLVGIRFIGRSKKKFLVDNISIWGT
mmetsp:Transcript_56401/g.136859  ORF Transcript_56401/g.136859 Transcript_56401/m.136859 type:complete len:850 (+) Transcript_56401:1929-4478(+)